MPSVTPGKCGLTEPGSRAFAARGKASASNAASTATAGGNLIAVMREVSPRERAVPTSVARMRTMPMRRAMSYTRMRESRASPAAPEAPLLMRVQGAPGDRQFGAQHAAGRGFRDEQRLPVAPAIGAVGGGEGGGGGDALQRLAPPG